MSQAILFSDFNCPFCYALGVRIEAAGLSNKVSWRGVQHAAHLPIPMANADSGLAWELRHEVDTIRKLAPGLPITLPRGKPNTLPAIEACAAAVAVDAEKAHRLQLALYRTFWVDGADISLPEEIARIAKDCGLNDLEVTPEAKQLAESWQKTWWLSGIRGVPALVRDDGQRLVGLTNVEAITHFLDPNVT